MGTAFQLFLKRRPFFLSMASTSVHEFHRFRQSGWLSGAMTRVSRADNGLTKGQWATLIVAACLIVLTAWNEHRRAVSHQSGEMAFVRFEEVDCRGKCYSATRYEAR